ncbi:ABC transporter substrate-binding protein [Gynuella sunshinyii]|uniref:Probable sugar-binding periplasmic protein n=1 Tax=Gynuella sunshinyii YC6258 TaxID=1445510 RepID=A0A0C5VBM6_9GAMM|nr:ABC transporter substrate-binding protein [Gynuella sunshinyii]AJQ96730.1 ABC-type sugar transport system, periplasmic component [Gynuella sunshinyii YC6258]
MNCQLAHQVRIILKIAFIFAASSFVRAGEVEVLHYWTSGGEAAAINILKQMVQDSGHTWKDFVVTGGSGVQARSELNHRVLLRNPPAATVLKGESIKRWARFNYLANLDEISKREDWDAKLPKVIADDMKFEGHYVATPVNVHRSNWMWVNKPILDAVGAKVPTNWAEFEAVAKKIQKAGYPVIAAGNEPWQDATLFESVALAVGGSEFYLDAFVKHDTSVLRSKTMDKVFEQMDRLKPFLAPSTGSEAWDAATKQVINGEAAFQFMGDWAKGEFILANKQPGRDYICATTPGTEGSFIYVVDSFAMFKLEGESKIEAQLALASDVMSERFQIAFNKAKGSIPARIDLSLNGFDQCAQKSKKDFMDASQNGMLLPSIAHGMATTEQVLDQFSPSVAKSWRNGVEPDQAAAQLSKAIRYGVYYLQ